MAYAQIELDRGEGPYFSGEILSGKVYVTRRGILTKSITVQCVGKATTFFGVSYIHRGHSYEMKDEEEFINQQICIFNIGESSSPRLRNINLYEETSSSNCTTTTTGPAIQFGPENFYRFLFNLPLTLPTSFAETEGYISYKVSAQLLLFGTNDNYDLNPKPVEIPFRVKKNIDLNVHPLAGLSIELRDYKYFGCFTSCTVMRGAVILYFKINQRGFTPGETITFTTEINNNSNGNLTYLKVFIMQDLVFYAGVERRRMTLTLCTKQGQGVRRGENLQWTDSLVLPTNPTFIRTCSINCGIIQIHHQIHIQLVALKWITQTEEVILEGCIPLIVGDIPLRPSPLPDTEDLLFSPGIANYYSRSPSPCPPFTTTTTIQNSSSSSSYYPMPNFSDSSFTHSSPPRPHDEHTTTTTSSRNDPPEYYELDDSTFSLNEYMKQKTIEENSPPTYTEATTTTTKEVKI